MRKQKADPKTRPQDQAKAVMFADALQTELDRSHEQDADEYGYHLAVRFKSATPLLKSCTTGEHPFAAATAWMEAAVEKLATTSSCAASAATTTGASGIHGSVIRSGGSPSGLPYRPDIQPGAQARERLEDPENADRRA